MVCTVMFRPCGYLVGWRRRPVPLPLPVVVVVVAVAASSSIAHSWFVAPLAVRNVNCCCCCCTDYISRGSRSRRRDGVRGNCYCLAAICRECQRDHKPQTDLRRKRLKLRGDLLLLMLSCKRKGNRIANIATRYKTLKLKKKMKV